MFKLNNVTILFLLLSVLVLSCKKTPKNEIETVSLRQEWFPFSGYAGEVCAVSIADSIYNYKLVLEPGSDVIDPIKLVLSGQNDFGVVSADRILSANDQGADLVVIGVVNYISPTCFIAKKESMVNGPKDFEGKRVGILTGTNTELVYKVFKSSLKLDASSITEIEIPFDLATFISGNYDIRPAFIYDEPVSLDLHGIEYTIVEPKDYGIDFIGTVYFTRRETVEKKPELVQAFVNSISDGWKMTLDDPDMAISLLKDFDKEIDIQRETLSLKKGISYFEGEGNRVLFASEARWQKMADYLIELGVIEDFNFEATVNNSFVTRYHQSTKSTTNTN